MTRAELAQEIQNVKEQIDRQLGARRAGAPGPGTIQELSSITQELSNLAKLLMMGDIPQKSQRWLASVQIVTGAWDFREPLGEAICKIEHLYRHELVEA